MESKWCIYQKLYHEIALNATHYQTYCKDVTQDIQTELAICSLIYDFSEKFITDTFDTLHSIDLDFVEAMIKALKNYLLLSTKILIEKNEKNCQKLAEIIMDRIIWHYTGSNYGLADIK